MDWVTESVKVPSQNARASANAVLTVTAPDYSNETELYKRLRPVRFEEVFGQDEAVMELKTYLARNTVPRTILFTGDSGCGKTTLARILRVELGCASEDFQEFNCAIDRGIDMVRDIRKGMFRKPYSTCLVYLIDEVHRCTPDAQSAFLKILEDTPSHVYFLLATTDPHKLLTTIKTRSTIIPVKSISDHDMAKLLDGVLVRENRPLSDAVFNTVIATANGSARAVLVTLHKVLDLPSEQAQIAAIASLDNEQEAKKIVHALVYSRGAQDRWNELRELIKHTKEEPEKLRRMILSWCEKAILDGAEYSDRCAEIIETCKAPWYDCGRPGLTLACYNLMRNKPGQRRPY
jgi:DNA polymerase III gamma/tau subunit